MRNSLYFLKHLNKVMNSRFRIARYMQQQRSATRPQIAAALGLSQVSTNAAIAALAKEGVVTPGTLIASGGGRPVQLYHFNPGHAAVALVTTRPEPHCTLLHLEFLDMQGKLLGERQARFAQVHAESLDDWLDSAARVHKLCKICLAPGLGPIMQSHLQKRHNCHVQELYAAEALVSGQENTLTLLLQKGKAPQGAMLRHGCVSLCPLLHLLPLPAEWETLDYADHTLVEEMLARMLQLLTCTLNPAHIELHANFWNDRLISRLNFNLSTKLRNILSQPALHFSALSETELEQKLRRRAVCAEA